MIIKLETIQDLIHGGLRISCLPPDAGTQQTAIARRLASKLLVCEPWELVAYQDHSMGGDYRVIRRR